MEIAQEKLVQEEALMSRRARPREGTAELAEELVQEEAPMSSTSSSFKRRRR